MNLHTLLLTNNECYKYGKKMTVKGIMVHSTGANNPNFGKKWTPEQIANRQAHREYARGAENKSSKPIIQKTIAGEFVKKWPSIREAGKVHNITGIKDCLRGKYKQSHGFVWEYEAKDDQR